MDAAPLYTLYDAFAGDRHTFLYSGQFLDAHTARLIALGEGAVGNTEADKALRARLAFVLVEAYQNIIRHRPVLPAVTAQNGGRSLFLLRNAVGMNEVSTMNPIRRTEADALVADLNGLGSLDTAQLKSRYLETLQQEGRTQRGGAGLGLIEMARRSGNTLRHGLSPIDAEHLLFTLSIDVEPAHAMSSTVHDLQHWHRLVVEAGVVLLCTGLGNAAVTASLLRILDQETADDTAIARRSVQVAKAGMEMLQHLGADPAHSALALLRTPQGPALNFAAVLPQGVAAEAISHAMGSNNSSHAASPVQRAMDDLAKACDEGLQVLSRPDGASRAWLMITAPLARP